MESYFKIIEQILIPNWRNEVQLGKNLRHIIDPVKLCSVNIKVLTSISEDLEAADKAELKNQRIEWNTRYSVQKRKKEYNNLERVCQQLQIHKSNLTDEKMKLKEEISFYMIELRVNPM